MRSDSPSHFGKRSFSSFPFFFSYRVWSEEVIFQKYGKKKKLTHLSGVIYGCVGPPTPCTRVQDPTTVDPLTQLQSTSLRLNLRTLTTFTTPFFTNPSLFTSFITLREIFDLFLNKRVLNSSPEPEKHLGGQTNLVPLLTLSIV